VETPSYLGTIETQVAAIGELAHAAGALLIVGVDPISLGVLEAPGAYGADLVCGDLQPLGNHMNCGGGLSGFMAFPDDERFVSECPLILFGIAETIEPGEYGFGEVMFERTSYAMRDQARDWVGTSTGLMGIAASVYLALLGPHGMRELGETIVQRSHYAADRLSSIPGVAIRFPDAFFKEFVVDFGATGRSVADINAALLDRGIFGGKDLSDESPDLASCALYCVTEVHTADDIDLLRRSLTEVLR
jgi:glycine dehydrogenase subunit 1